MKNLRKEMLKLRITKWRNLTLGEKVTKVILTVVKWALIVAVGYVVLNVVAAIAIAVFAAFAIAGAFADGFRATANAYRPGDRYIWFR